MTLPSKELLSAVLGCEITYCHEINGELRYGIYTPIGTDERTINIYELMHLMKEWALKQGYLLYSVPTMCLIKTLSLEYIKEFSDVDTEFESVTKACEWIKENNEE